MQAAWHVAQYAAHHAVAVDMDDMLALSGKSVQRISSAADVGSVVHELASASTNPEPIAVLMRCTDLPERASTSSISTATAW